MNTSEEPLPITSANGTDGSGALPEYSYKARTEKKWYVAYLRVHYERRAQEQLAILGYASWLAAQKEIHQWSDRKKVILRFVIPGMIFLHVTEKEADIIERLSFVVYILRKPDRRTVKATIPDNQMKQFRKMVQDAESKIYFDPDTARKGDWVRVCAGKLKGLVGQIDRRTDGKQRFSIVIQGLGCASVHMDAAYLVRCEEPKDEYYNLI